MAALQKMFFKDTALIRYDESQCYENQNIVQVVNDTGLMGIFGKRTNDDTWKKLDCIQTNVCSQIGCGTPIIVSFYAPIDKA